MAKLTLARPRIATYVPRELDRRFGLVFGAVLPLLAAMLFRTYHYTVKPDWLDYMRQTGMLWIVAAVFYIRRSTRQGLNPITVVAALPAIKRALACGFIATFWISSLFISRNVGFSFGLAFGWIVMLLFAIALYEEAQHVFFEPASAAEGFVIGLLGLLPVVALHLATVPPGTVIEYMAVVLPGWVSQRLFGAWAGAVMALLIGVSWEKRSVELRPWWLDLGIAVAFGLIVWTGTRAAMVGLVLPVAAGLLLTRRPGSWHFWLRLAGSLAAGTIAAALCDIGDGSFGLLQRGSGVAQGTSGFFSGRLALWHDALVAAAAHPWIGNGMGANLWLVQLDGVYHVQPHNAVVQFLLTWGLVPTVCALALLGLALWRVHQIAWQQARLLPLLAMLDTLLAMSLVDGMLHFPRFVIMIFSLFALIFSQRRSGAASG